jgi:23S rRNA pseudouridine2604 synthase
MADDSKRSKLSLPGRPADAPSTERRSRPPLRGSSKPRAPKPVELRPAREGGERPPREGQGSGDRPRGNFRNGERPQRDGRSFDERRPRPTGDRPRADDSRPVRPAGPRREEDRRGFGDRLPREEFRGGAGRGFDERRPQGDRPPRRDGERPAFNDRPPRSFNDRGPQGQNDRRPSAERSERPQRGFRDDGGDRRFGNDNRQRPDGERAARRPAFEGRDDNRAGAERRPQGDRPAFNRDPERRPFPAANDRPPREARSFGERDGHREERRPPSDRPARPAFRDGDRPRADNRSTEARRPYAEGAPREGDRPARPAFRDERPRHDEAPRTYAERPRRDIERDGPAPAPTFGDDQMPAAPQGRSFGRSRAEPRAEQDAAPQNPAFEQDRPRRPAPPERFANPPAEHPADLPGAMRLSKRMSELGLCSRREADEYIERGWVTVDGKVIAELGAKVMPEQRIELNTVAEEMQMRRVTILINKPIGYVSGQAEDGYEPAAVLITPENHWTDDPVRRRFESRLVRKLAPAGRLDIDSTGLLVLTQDGRVAKQLIGEYSEIEKEYLVRVEGELSADGMRLLHHGLTLDGVELLPAKVSWQNEDQLRFVLQEGRKRQIRRMCEMVGLKVVGLKRIRIGRIPLGKLPVGQWRYLSEFENF